MPNQNFLLATDKSARAAPLISMGIDRAVVVATPAPGDRPWLNVGAGPKPLMPVATKPILVHTLDALASSGVCETVLVIEAGTADVYRAVVGDGSSWGMDVSYAFGDPQAGIGDAIRVAGDAGHNEPIVVQRADAMLRGRLSDHIERFADAKLDALALMLERRRTSAARPRMAGGYILSPGAISIMRSGPVSSDPFARLRRQGGQIEECDVAGCLACDGDASGLLEANRLALSHIAPDITASCLESSEIQGDVVVHPSARLKNSLVRGPAIIGPDCRIVDAYIGPYTSVGARVCIEGSEIEYSIVMDDARLMFVGARLETSIIGRAAEIVRRFEMPNALRVSVGDGAHVALS